MKKADGKQPVITVTPADGQPATPPTDPSQDPPLQSLKDFRFPVDNDAITTVGDTLTALPVSDVVDQATEATAGSTKTKASKRVRAKKLQKRVVLKIRDLGARLKKRLQKGKKKMTPKTPALKLKVEIDNPAQAAGDAAAGLPHAAPAA